MKETNLNIDKGKRTAQAEMKKKGDQEGFRSLTMGKKGHWIEKISPKARRNERRWCAA